MNLIVWSNPTTILSHSFLDISRNFSIFQSSIFSPHEIQVYDNMILSSRDAAICLYDSSFIIQRHISTVE